MDRAGQKLKRVDPFEKLNEYLQRAAILKLLLRSMAAPIMLISDMFCASCLGATSVSCQ